MTKQKASPKLAPPGAGLPWIELQVARGIFRAGLATSSQPKCALRIMMEQQRILNLIEGVSIDELSRQVLIKRLRGLEDSSRYWSVFMTVSHVSIVNRVVGESINLLLQNRNPEVAASTASVKPDVSAGVDSIKELLDSCESLSLIKASPLELRTERKYSHPWFGPLDARGWYFLAGFHMRLHRKQIEQILHNLNTDLSMP
jgi:hypothetical protein